MLPSPTPSPWTGRGIWKFASPGVVCSAPLRSAWCWILTGRSPHLDIAGGVEPLRGSTCFLFSEERFTNSERRRSDGRRERVSGIPVAAGARGTARSGQTRDSRGGDSGRSQRRPRRAGDPRQRLLENRTQGAVRRHVVHGLAQAIRRRWPRNVPDVLADGRDVPASDGPLQSGRWCFRAHSDTGYLGRYRRTDSEVRRTDIEERNLHVLRDYRTLG